MPSCIICNHDIETNNTYTCDWCSPDTCYKCSASQITCREGTVTCSHGCEYSIHEHATHHYYTVLLNGSAVEKLAVSGPEIEVIIPNGTPLTVHETQPDTNNVPDSHIVLLHYTHDKQTVLNDGIEYPPNENSRDSEEPTWAHNTIRHNAIYAWPFTTEYTANVIEAFANSTYTDAVYLTVPEDDVYVSAYEYLNCIQDTSDEVSFSLTESDVPGVQLPPEKYESELVFDIDTLRESARKHTRPCSPTQLLV